jgi:RimJ/RimL family protein N-acetyltransferase
MDLQYKKEVKLKSGRVVILRIPQLIDAKALSDYINDLFDEDTFISSRKQTVEDEESYIKSMLRKIESGKEIHIVGMFGDKKVAAIDIFSTGVRKDHVGELQINIAKDFRGEGLGNILMEEALRYAKDDLKLKVVTLTCFSINKPALKLYEKFGFKEFGRLEEGIQYKNEFITEIYMSKVI